MTFDKWWMSEGNDALVLSRRRLCELAFLAGMEAQRIRDIEIVHEVDNANWYKDRLFREAANKNHERMVALCNLYKSTIEELTLKLATAEVELQDWRDSAARASGEQCEGEHHCNCVGVLRKELKSTRHNSDQFFQLWQKSQNELEKLRRIVTRLTTKRGGRR